VGVTFTHWVIVVISFFKKGVILTMENMARITEILEFLKTLILSSNHDTLKVNKFSLTDIQVCLQNAQEKINFLQLESQLQQEELK